VHQTHAQKKPWNVRATTFTNSSECTAIIDVHAVTVQQSRYVGYPMSATSTPETRVNLSAVVQRPSVASTDGQATVAWRSMAERQDLFHLAAFYKRIAIPALVGWLMWLPCDCLLAWTMYPGTLIRSFTIRMVACVGLAVCLWALARPRSYGTMTAALIGLALMVNGGVALVAIAVGGLASPYQPGPLVVLAVLGFSPLPWKRLVPIVVAAWAVYPLVMVVWAMSDPVQRVVLQHPERMVSLIAVTVVGLIVGGFACVGASLSWSLRQQVFESRSIGRYQLRRRFGMGEVWAAWHKGLHREVALKILRASEGNVQAAERFEREVSAMTELAHPNTVRVFDYGITDDGLTYYAMEFLRGSNLVELVHREGPLPTERAVFLLTQAARALAEAHGRGMVHRDVKPENLFVTNAGGEQDFIKVLDFGIVRRQNDDDKQLTQTGSIAGTPAYIAPEVVRGEAITAAADVYGLGAVLYFLLTGRAPFEGQTAVALLLAHLNEPVKSPSLVLGKTIAPDVENLILRCLSKTTAERPADGRALAEELANTSVSGRWSSRHAESLKGPRAMTDAAFAATQENLTIPSGSLRRPGVTRNHDH
jgi:eukaryotic-like serine/threonine-protein kinase